MKPIDTALEQKLRAHPNAHVRVIVRTSKPPADCVAALPALNLRAVYTSTLINAITVEGTAQNALALNNADWVVRVEEDKPVHTM